MAEAEDVLQRAKFDALVSRAARAEFLVRYREAVKFIPIVSRIEVCRDARDDKFLDLAFDGNAGMIVTGDDDLLVLNPFRGIRIVTPRQFLALNEEQK
jgi:putative PIN family toxin of toxin-antitoxin system